MLTSGGAAERAEVLKKLAMWHICAGHLSAIISSGEEGPISLHKEIWLLYRRQLPFLGGILAGRALEALLQGVGYDTRLIEDPPEIAGAAPRRGQAPAPRPYPERRVEGDSAREMGTLDAANIPVLTLSTSLKEALAGGPAFIPWPCRLEDLDQKIEAALLHARS